DAREQAVEELPGLADEGDADAVLVVARRLADEHEVRVGVAVAEHDLRPGAMQGAALAARDLGAVVLLELRGAVVHGSPERSAGPGRRRASVAPNRARCGGGAQLPAHRRWG